MNTGHSVNQKILRLWEETFKEEADVLLPLFYSSLKQNAIVFVGLNPSFSQKGYANVLSGTALSDFKPSVFYHWSNRKSFDFEIDLAIDQIERDKYGYFRRFKDIAGYANSEWEHIDLFFYRETSQTQFRRSFYPNDQLTEFAQKQLDLSKLLIVEAKPKVIVVANAFASFLFQRYFSGVKFDERYGYHMVPLADRLVPTFFSSMLTGQRALDRFSYERLRWHIKRAINVAD